MSQRVLLLGVGPRPTEQAERVHAPGLRLQWFLDTLLEAGHDVMLGEFTFGGEAVQRFTPSPGVQAHRLLPLPVELAAAELAHWCRQSEPTAVVALTDVGALAAVRSGCPAPLYVDYFGDPMAERQQQAAVHGSNAAMADAWLHVLPALLRADRFSVCNPAQRLVLTGQLAAAGRLGGETCGHDLVDVIPITLPFEHPITVQQPNIMEQWGVPAGSRTVFTSGGFNTWLDEATLFAGLELAMERDPSLHFVATGGAIPGHVEVVFQRFQQRAQQSPNWRRFHFPGWVPHNDLLDGMMAADVGVNMDHPTLEGELGTRNRLLGWAWAGMRIAATVMGDPADRLATMGLLTPVPFGDAGALADALVARAAEGRHRQLDSIQAQLLAIWGRRQTLAPLRTWMQSPAHAPDHGLAPNPLAEMQQRFLDYAEQHGAELAIRRKARDLGNRLAGSRMVRLATAMNHEAQRLIEELREL